MHESLRPVQECRTLEGWQPLKIQSHSDEDRQYTVLVNPWGIPEDNICECAGYMYRGYCRHQDEAQATLCQWSETTSNIEQSPEQRKYKVCPQCLGPTKWAMEVVE